MKKLLEKLDKKIREKIEEEWYMDHFGGIDNKYFEREYERACDKIIDFLLTQI